MGLGYDIEGVPITGEGQDLFGRWQRPLPDYALMVDYAPAIERISPEERRRRVADLRQKVKEGVTRIQGSTEFRNYLLFMSRFHDYSWHNQLLIMFQRPDATLVRGFHGWKDVGRYVKKGETGIRILAPSGPTGEVQWVKATNGKTWYIRRVNDDWGVYENNRLVQKFRRRKDATQWVRDQGAVAQRNVVEAVNRFIDVTVFDIKQTEGKPIPVFEVPVLTGEMNKDLFEATLALMKKRDVTVTFEPRPHLDPGIKGSFMRPNEIWVKPDEPPAQQLKTLLHEAAHYYSAMPFNMPRADAETIAESSAFVVGAHHGFDTGVRSFPYVALWAKDEKTLDKNLDAIHKVAEHMIEELEGAEHTPRPVPPVRPIEPVRPEPKPEPVRLTLEQMEATYSADQVKRMAREKGVSTAGSKRDIIKRLI